MIRVFIGTEPSQKLPTQVLKHSIRARATEPVSFIEMEGPDSDYVGLTGFSLRRFHIPQLCAFEGRAIYLDADIVVLGNIAELWNLDLTRPALAKPYTTSDYFTSVMLLDCGRLRHWDFRAWSTTAAKDAQFANRLIWARPTAPNHDDFGPLPSQWNDLDIVKPATRALHFTQLPKQPWRHTGHHYGHVFRTALMDAMAEGSVTTALVEDEIEAGHVREDVLKVL